MQSRPNYYSVIPADVRYDKDLKANEKLLYGEITALSNHKGYCFAENSYFGKLYNVKKGTVSGWISNLEEKGYIKTELIYGQNKQVKERRIYLSNTLYDKNDIPPTIKDEYPMREKSQEELNITSTNITSINNNDNDNANSEKNENQQNQNQEPQVPKTEDLKPKSNKDVHRFYQENINAMETPYIAQELEYWIEDLGVDLVLEALRRAVKYNAEYGYAERIMKQWAKKNIDSLEKVKQADAAFEQQNKKRYGTGNKSKQINKYKLPDFINPDSKQEPVDEQPVDTDSQESYKDRLAKLRANRLKNAVE